MPQIQDDEVLLKIYAAGINRADLLQRAGQYPPPPGWPDWFGLEAAGVIEAVGDAVRQEGKWHVGDKVCALLGSGGYAEYAAVPEGLLMPVPKGLSLAQAAALLRRYLPGCALTTDVICGFPGETEEEFEALFAETIQFRKDMGIDKILDFLQERVDALAAE